MAAETDVILITLYEMYVASRTVCVDWSVTPKFPLIAVFEEPILTWADVIVPAVVTWNPAVP